ncbi:MAG TPA: hypothetical protein VF677_14830 [Flavobacterium sp.]|jgi:hypothetical protein
MKLNKKNKLLLLGCAIALYGSYTFAISKTLGYYKQYKSQSELVGTTSYNPQFLAGLVVKEKQIDEWLKTNNPSASSYQNELLKQLNIYCEKFNLKIVDFKEPHQFQDKSSITLNYSFSLEGSFNSVLKTIHKIENNPALGTIKHIAVVKKLNYKTNTNYIVTDIIITRSEDIKQ